MRLAIKYARDHNLSKIVVGRDHPRLWRPWYRSFADRVGQRAPDLDVLQVARSDADREPVKVGRGKSGRTVSPSNGRPTPRPPPVAHWPG